MENEQIHYAVVGHFIKDIVPGGHQLGGTVFYSGTQAVRLGAKVTIISSAGEDLKGDIAALDSGIKVHLKPAPESTSFENIYDKEGNRQQYTRGRALPLLPSEAPKLSPALLHLGPLVSEVALDYDSAYPDAKLCITPQGWMRRVDKTGKVHPKALGSAKQLLSRAWAVVFSEEDVGYSKRKERHLASLCPITVCTRNVSAATLYFDGREYQVPTYPTQVVDPTGAGDVFAVAFFIRLYETNDPETAVRFAHAAAALSIAGAGVSSVADRAKILSLRE